MKGKMKELASIGLALMVAAVVIMFDLKPWL